MNILMLGWEFPPYFAGGVGIVCYELTKALTKEGVKITYLMPSGPDCLERGVEDLENRSRILIADNIINDELIKNLNIKSIGSLLSPYCTEEDYLKRRRELIRKGDLKTLYGENLLLEIERFSEKAAMIAIEENQKEEFDIIHAHDWTTFKAAIKIKEELKKPLVVHVHITEFDKTGGEHADPRVYAIEREGMMKADLVIAVSNFVKNRLIEKYGIPPEKIRVVYNAVQFNTKPEIKEEYGLKGEKIVLFLGRMTLQKGPDYFVRAAEKVLSINPNVTFIMAGSGDMLPRIIEEVARKGLSRKFIFPGFVSREEGDRLYRMADLFVMPSVSEPFGIVPLEAMYQGTPVIVSKQSGVSEVLKNALKVDFWDVDEMANKMLAALSYGTMRSELIREGTKEVLSFNWEKPAHEVIKIYKELKRINCEDE